MQPCELLFWSEGPPPTMTVVFHGEGRDHLVTFRVEALQINELDAQGHIAKMIPCVQDGKVLERE